MTGEPQAGDAVVPGVERQGFVGSYQSDRGERGLYARRLVAAAREAGAGRRGLWGACPGARLLPGRQVETGRTLSPNG